MKPQFLTAALALSVATAFAAPHYANTTARHSQPLHFARGATILAVRGHIKDSQHRFYTLKTRAGQRLEISAVTTSKNPDKALVPLIFVTPPRGQYDGDKTANYTTNSTRAGDYKIEVGANLMASNSNSGDFILRVHAK